MNDRHRYELRARLVRPMAACVLFLLVLIAPWWVVLVCMFAFAVFFQSSLETIVASMCMIALHIPPFGVSRFIAYVGIIFCALLVYIIDKVKLRLAIFNYVK